VLKHGDEAQISEPKTDQEQKSLLTVANFVI
jgi:hypothetical protein